MASENSFELPPELIDRGVVWQVVGFAILGVAATSALAIYSDLDTLTFRFFEVATTKLNWAFVPTVAYIVDRSRKMFERKSEIRATARLEVLEKARKEGLEQGRIAGIEEGRIAGIEEGRTAGREEGERRAEDRLRSRLDELGIVVPPEFADQIFNHKNGPNS